MQITGNTVKGASGGIAFGPSADSSDSLNPKENPLNNPLSQEQRQELNKTMVEQAMHATVFTANDFRDLPTEERRQRCLEAACFVIEAHRHALEALDALAAGQWLATRAASAD